MKYARVVSGTPKTDEDLKDPKRVAAGKQGGRPLKSGVARNCNIQVKVTPEEHETISLNAKKLGMGVSDLIRAILLFPPSSEEKNIALLIDTTPTYINKEQAKYLYKQLHTILIGE